jgi:prophage regulatory protein
MHPQDHDKTRGKQAARRSVPPAVLATTQVAGRERFLALPAVIDRTSLKRSAIYDKMNRDEFPKPVRISDNRVAWPESRVDAWIAAKMAEAA